MNPYNEPTAPTDVVIGTGEGAFRKSNVALCEVFTAPASLTDYTDLVQEFISKQQPNTKLVFPKGVYPIQSVTIPEEVEGIEIVGEGAVFRCSIAQKYMFIVHADNVTFRGINFDNPEGYSSPIAPTGSIQIFANNTSIIGCHVDGMMQGVVIEPHGEYIGHIIANNRFTNMLGEGLENMGDAICTFASNCTIVGNYIHGKTGEDARIAINVEGLPNYRPDYDESGYNDDGLVTVAGNVIEGNGAYREGIHIEHVSNFSVVGNTIRRITRWGITLTGEYGTVTGNSIEAPPGKETIPAGSAAMAAIACITLKHTVIATNSIRGVTPITTTKMPHGIYSEAPCEDMSVIGNVIGGESGSLADGIHLDTTENSLIEGNKIEDGACRKNGVWLSGGAAMSVVGNKIQGAGENGIYMAAAPDSIISNNHIFDCGKLAAGDGINLVNPNKVIVNGNRCGDRQGTKTQQYGIFTFGLANSVMIGNHTADNVAGGIQNNSAGTGNTIADNI